MKKVFYVIYSVIDGKINLEKLFTAAEARSIKIDRYCDRLQAMYQDMYPNKKVSFSWDIVCSSNINNVFDSCIMQDI